MRTLEEIYADYTHSDKGSIHSYLSHYETLFSPYRETADEVWEVGVREGDSLRAWAEYFPHAVITGFDNGSEKGLPTIAHDRIGLVVADTTRPGEFFRKLHEYFDTSDEFDAFPRQFVDIIIDDGNHKPLAQAATFAMLSPFLKPGGIYVVEDVEDPLWCEQFVWLFGGEWIDLRSKKERHDDLLVVLRKPK
jgi:hypothetical protein